MSNFWDFEVWGWMILMAVLLGSLLAGNILKKTIPILQRSLIPTSVLGGAILLIVAAVFKAITGEVMFDTAAFNGNGTNNLEIITYHALALGFIASSFKTSGGKLNKQRTAEIFNSGVTTVATYLLQAVLGMIISMVAVHVMKDFFVHTARGMPMEWPPPRTSDTVGFFMPAIISAMARPASMSPPTVFRRSNRPSNSSLSSIPASRGRICSYFVVLQVSGSTWCPSTWPMMVRV